MDLVVKTVAHQIALQDVLLDVWDVLVHAVVNVKGRVQVRAQQIVMVDVKVVLDHVLDNV